MGAVVTISLRDLPERVRRDVTFSRRAIERGTLVGAERSRGIVVRRTPTDQGQLRASWKVKPGLPGSGDRELAELANDAPHAGIVELGARPHKVSPEGWVAIYEWVRRHPELYTRSGSRKNPNWQGPNLPRMRRPLKGLGDVPFQGPDPEISEITNAIVRKFAREGQKPTYFVRDSIEKCARATISEISHEFARLADEAAHEGWQ